MTAHTQKGRPMTGVRLIREMGTNKAESFTLGDEM
jgi:hypothetical protein